VKLAGDQQLPQPLGIALIRLDAISRPPRDQPRGAHQTAHTDGPQPASEREAGRPRLIRRAHWTGNEATNSQTSPPRPDNRCRRSSPESRSMIAATVALTCTSSATNVLACAMVGTPMIAVPAEATPRRQPRASHARVPTLTPCPDRPTAQDDRP
jgi:hypothetical protein